MIHDFHVLEARIIREIMNFLKFDTGFNERFVFLNTDPFLPRPRKPFCMSVLIDILHHIIM